MDELGEPQPPPPWPTAPPAPAPTGPAPPGGAPQTPAAYPAPAYPPPAAYPPAAPAPAPDGSTVYTVPPGGAGQAVGALVTGGVMLLVVLLRFVLLIAAAASADRPERGGRGGVDSGLIGGLGAAGILFVTYGLSALRRPVRARVTPAEIVVEGRLSRRAVPWASVAQVRRDKATETLGQQKVDVVTLLDERGKKMAKLTSGFFHFESLVAEIEARSAAARGRPTYDRAADLARKAAAHRRSRWKTAALFGLLTAFGAAAASWGSYEWYVQRRLDRDGVDTRADIDRHYLVRVTGYVDFSFADPATGRRVSRSATVGRDDWEALAGKKSVSVRYVPGRPDWNRVAGESGREGSPVLMAVLSAGFTALFGAGLLFTALGYADLTIKDGKVRVKRYGEVDDELEPSPAVPRPPAIFPGSGQAMMTGPPPGAYPAAVYPSPYPYGQPPQQSPAPPWGPPPAPPAPLPPGLPAPPRRPGGITAIAVLNILLGLLGMTVNGLRLWMVTVCPASPIGLGRTTVMVESDLVAATWIGADLLLATALAVSAVGLLRLKPWGRRLALGVAALQLVSSLADAGAGAWAMSADLPDLVGEERTFAIAAFAGRLIGAALGAAYPVVLLVVLGRRSAAEAFQRDAEGR